jgi:RNA-directed DNA polymerase
MMNLMTQITSDENLYDAWRRVRANKGGMGIDGVSWQMYEGSLETNLAELQRQLRDETYCPASLRRLSMPKPNGGYRELAIPTLHDRVAQRAFVNVLEQVFENLFLDCSFGYRPERSVEHAILFVNEYRREGCTWMVDADIERFFDSIQHERLMNLFRQHVSDAAVSRVIHLWLTAGVMTGGRPPRLPHTGTGLRGIAEYVGEVAQEMVNHLLGRESFGMPVEAMMLGDDDWTENPLHLEKQERQRALRRFGKDALLLAFLFRRQLAGLLSSSRLVKGSGLLITLLMGVLFGRQYAGQVQARRFYRGAPQGGPISPLLANLYLHPLDERMQAEGLRYVRYADDFVICCPSEARARHALQVARKELQRIDLKLNEAKTVIRAPQEEFEFLGYLLDKEGAVQMEEPRFRERIRSFLQRKRRG